MKYYSSRSERASYSSAEAITHGLAHDGGLFVPERVPKISGGDFDALTKMSYPERAALTLSRFLDDFDIDDLCSDCESAYSSPAFPENPAPMHKLNDGVFSLELWHGPTCAFKDMALQLMPRLLSRAAKITGENKKIHILTATSGDTGKAALEGFSGVDGVKITVFYPKNGVSAMQERQMCSTLGDNVYVCGIRGSFDDAQRGVKAIFTDDGLGRRAAENGFIFGSANSINWGRLVPQVVYYISAYCDLVNSGELSFGDEVNIAVPTGNFGNIYAAYLASRMGLPVHRLVCASNSNNVLTDFINTGVYDRNREFKKTVSPSMDILVSSNLERLLYTLGGAEVTDNLMAQLKESGRYAAPESIMTALRSMFSGYYLNEEETLDEIKRVWDEDGYLIDPHTSVGMGCVRKYRSDTGDGRKFILASTASAYKFAPAVCSALGIEPSLTSLSDYTATPIPEPLLRAERLPIRFTEVISPEEMPSLVFRV